MSPVKRSSISVSATAPAKKHKTKSSANAIRRAVARRRIEERREAEWLRAQLHEVFDED
ncbi:hypothetical protein QVG61_02980 [Thiohalobacter sp. IOR34]|uniref:PA3496 family putative envelope integrity protein n=1 Tax=Thiohalobacter sp. IOR34 TaxID=3057176 RepID=UPI0025B21C32|nr:hypothetical protein [Thiohalobacter sp. IOR34]WJW76073.1 hypothetical protein QVG61_02980 [Thiohalobacter sp. IOR34]